MLTVFMGGLAVFLLIIAAPIFVAILAPTILTFELFGPQIPSMVMVQPMMQGVNKFSLIAVPLFIFAAAIISNGEIGKRLVNIVESFVGHITGGVAITVVVTCALFGAISGVGQAAIVTIGPIVYPALLRQGYSKGFSVGLIVGSSTLAMLVPPGIAMILYALQTFSSVGQVFLAGLATGLVFTVLLSIYAYIYARLKEVGRQPKKSWQVRRVSLLGGGWAMGLPIIIFGGIYSGVFTPTEAAAGACIYAIFIEIVIYRTLNLRGLFRISEESAILIASILIMLAAGSTMSYYLTLENIPQLVAGVLESRSLFEVLIIINLIFLIAGMFIDPNSAIIVLTPLIFPAAEALSIDPIHLGAIVVFNIAIGMVTPPFGLNLFMGMITFKISYGEIVKSIWPFVAVALIALALISFIPNLIMWLPRMVGF